MKSGDKVMDKIKPQQNRQPDIGGLKYRVRWLLLSILAVSITSCTTTSTAPVSRRVPEERGFFTSLMDQVTERECNVGRFMCPYGLGPAGESCTCTDPSGIVLNGRTVK
jgi:hypothetical protein